MTTSRSAAFRAVVGLATALTVALPGAALADTGVPVPPTITVQPASAAVTDGDEATFTVAYTGEPEPTVRWERSDDDGATWQGVDAANTTAATATLVLAADQDDTGAQVRAQVANEAGAATSTAASLTVVPAVDPAAGDQPEASGDDGSTGDGADGESTGPPAGVATEGSDAPPAADPTQPAVAGVPRAAPASSATLGPGTYTITANLYVAGVDAPIGVNVYLTDGVFPPVTPQKQNAVLTVADDGAMELTVDLAQEAFTLQQLGDGDGVRVLAVERGGTISWMAGKPDDPPYQDRITRVTVALDDTRGEYTFGDALEYPSVLLTEKYWAIHLGVDFASAVRQLEGDFSQTYRHEATGTSVTVAAEAGDDAVDLLSVATLDAAALPAGAALVTEAVERAYVTTPTFTAWTLDLVSGSRSVDLAGCAVTVSLPVDVTNPEVYLLTDGTLEALVVTTLEPGRVTVETARLGTFVVADGDSGTAWQRTKTFSSDVGTTMTYRSTGVLEVTSFGVDFDALDAVGLFAAFLGEELSPERAAEATEAVSQVERYQDPEVRVFTFGLDMSLEDLPYATADKHQSFLLPLGNGYNSLSGSVPVEGGTGAVYLVSGTVAEGLTTAVRLDTVSDGSSASFDLVAKTEDTLATGSMPQLALWNAATGMSGTINTPQTADTPIAYVVVVREAPTAVDKPTAAQGLVYDGTAQVGVAAGEGYTLSIAPSATAAGQHVAQAALEPGYVWSDGTTGPVVLPWSIAEAELTVTYADEQVPAGGTPRLTVLVDGFVGGETAATASGYVAPTVSLPGSLSPGRSYTLVPAGGQADNYTFVYHSGVLTVAEESSDWQPGTYRITANLFVPAAENDILHLTAYMTNPKNPLAPEGSADYGIPTEPVSGNATLVIGTDGSQSLVLDLPNPAFTLVDFGTSSGGATVRGVERDGGTYGTDTRGRITRAVVGLDTVGSSTVFVGSHVYAVPLSLAKTWDLTLAVDSGSATRISDSTAVPALDGAGTSGGTGTGGSGWASTESTAATGPTASSGLAAASGTLRAGTYTVSANIWMSRNDTGLPLDPHLTSSEFPPMNPVQDNATLVVALDGSARVTVPITIQSRIMTVRSLTGAGASTSGGEAINSVTVDLGRLDAGSPVVTRSMTVSVTIGDLAMSIGGPLFGGTREHTWPATFRMNLDGVPTSGGGEVPAWLSAALVGQDAATAGEDASEALDAARAANEESRAAARGRAAGAAADGAQAGSGLPWSVLVAVLVVLVAAGAAAVLWARRHRTAPWPTRNRPNTYRRTP